MIEVRIQAHKLNSNWVHANREISKRLRDEGVPVVGVFGPVSVEHGVLEMEMDDLAVPEYVYRWRP